MNWYSRAQALLAQPFRPSCPTFESALELVESGQFLEAAEALKALDGMQRFFASFVIELRAVELGADDAALAAMCAFVSEMPTNSVDAHDIPHNLFISWAKIIGVRLPVDALMSRDKFGYGNSLLSSCIEELCELGQFEKAAAFARKVNAHYRDKVARLWARIGLGLPEGALRNEALMTAAKAGDARPKIQYGGEEANAHGEAIEAFAKGGLPHNHPAVATSVKGLLKLANSVAQRSAPAWGTQRAIIAACLRAADDLDANWREIGKQLQSTIWGSGLDEAGKAAVMLADLRLGALASNAVTDSEQILRAKAERKYHAAGSPEEVAALREAGEDVENRIQAYLDEWDGYGHRSVKRFIMACRLRLPTERLEALLEAVPEREKPEALVQGACYGLANDPRRMSYLERGYPEGDQFGILTAHLLPILTPTMLQKAEEFYGATGRVDGLGILAAWHLKQGNIANAVNAISRFTQPESGKEPWVPRYRRGNLARVSTVNVVDSSTVPAAIKEATHARELVGLARGLEKGSPAWQQVMAAAHLKKWEKPMQFAALVELRLMQDDVEAAIGYLPQSSDERDRADAMRKLAQYINQNRAQVAPSLDKAWSETCLAILTATHPQWAFGAISHVAQAIATITDPAERTIAMQRMIQIGTRLYRCEGDRAKIHSGFSRGFYATGNMKEAMASMAQALELAGKAAIYLHASVIGKDLAAMREGWPREEWLKAVQKSAEASVRLRGKDYEQLGELEDIALALWKNGEVAAVNAMLQNPTFPTTLRQDLRRSIWADIDLSPDPLASLEGAWPTEALPREVTAELMRALNHALRKVGHPEAEAVARLWEG